MFCQSNGIFQEHLQHSKDIHLQQKKEYNLMSIA